MFMNLRIKRELKELKEFKKTFKFEMKEIVETKNGKFCDGVMLEDKNGNLFPESETWINVHFKHLFSLSKMLSNLFQYRFYFRGKRISSSIEAVLHGIMFKDVDAQNHVLRDGYSGLNANVIKYASQYDWRKTGILYWQGKPIIRESEEYYDFIDELYVSAIQNPLLRGAIKNAGDKYIMHSIGGTDPKQTVLMRCEFEYELNLLREFLRTR